MEIIRLLAENLGSVAFAILGMGGVLAFFYAGWLYQMAHGDPQQMAKARNAFFGGVIGILLGGFAFVIPEIISTDILGRSGGDPIVARASSECDGILRSRLAVEAQANTPARMNQIVRLIQAENSDGCGADLWDPHIAQELVGGPFAPPNRVHAHYRISCFGAKAGGFQYVNELVNYPYDVANVQVPASFIYDPGSGVVQKPRPVSSRDTRNNILVYFGRGLSSVGAVRVGDVEVYSDSVSTSLGRPTDGSSCWLFIARENVWISQ